ncbi:response regulator, partial [Sphingobacteriales bacterium CHB3]|nr:response regulator [Sphingobacteriales bacterium CHB3]
MDKRETGILVVDDELIVRESLTKWFREDGFRSEAAENAAAALRKLQNSNWDISLVDIKMPGMDGIELLQRMKELKPDMSVIIITA